MSGWIWLAVILIWMVGALVAWAFIYGATRSDEPDWIWAPDDEQPGMWRKSKSTDGVEHGNHSDFLSVVVAQGSENDGIYHVPISGGTYQIDGVEEGVEIHSGPIPWNVNYWELDEQGKI